MGTIINEPVASALFGKTRRVILSLLFRRPGEELYLRQIIKLSGSGRGAVQREMENLLNAGIVARRLVGRQTLYSANKKSLVYEELKSLILKTAGLGDVLREALSPVLPKVRLAFIYGSFASGLEKPSSDIDVMIVGDANFGEVVSALQYAQKELAREINPSVYPVNEFRGKLEKGNSFISSVINEPKIYIIGDEIELARLAGRRLSS